jgi:hypothetical protein
MLNINRNRHGLGTAMRLAIALSALALLVEPVCAQPATSSAATDYRAPRTSFGHPSLEATWVSGAILPLEAIPEASDLVVPEAEAKRISDLIVKYNAELPFNFHDPEVPEMFRETGRTSGLAIVRGQRRTRQIVDPPSGILPVTPAARARIVQLDQFFESSVNPPLGPLADNPEQRPVWERCVALQGTPPLASPQATAPLQIFQTREHVVLLWEYGGEARIIPFSDKHKRINFRNPLGDSIARWDGETLVIETINIHPADTTRVFPTLFLSPRSKITEKLTRVSEQELLYQYTVEDPGIYNAPWLAEYSFYRTGDKMYEFACHEGNYSLPNIMRGQRVAEARAAGREY